MATDYLRLIVAIKRGFTRGKGHGDRLFMPDSGNQKVKATA